MNRSAQQQYASRNQAKGLCVNCPTPTSGRYCDYHKGLRRKYQQDWRSRNRRPRSRVLLHEEPWVGELLQREHFTSQEAGNLAGIWGADAINRMRASRFLKVIVLGKDLNAKHYRTALYKIELATEQKGIYERESITLAADSRE